MSDTYKSLYFPKTDTDCQCGCKTEVKEILLKFADRVAGEWIGHGMKKGYPLSKCTLRCNSGARCMKHTEALRMMGIPAALKSAHMEGLAIDLAPIDKTMIAEFQDFCERNVPIWACRMEDKKHTKSWVHLDLKGVGVFTPDNKIATMVRRNEPKS
jgi:hypothetical protein